MRSPSEIRKLPDSSLSILWNDGSSSTIAAEKLRRACPCAQCLQAKGDTSHDKPLTAKKGFLNVVTSSLTEETKLIKVWPVGNYAIGLEWADGHKTGIYSFSYLTDIG